MFKKCKVEQERNEIVGWADSDWANEWMSDARSRSGSVVTVGSNIIDWKTAKQKSIADSSTEAEINAVYSTVKLAEQARSRLIFLGFETGVIQMLTDNLACEGLVTSKYAMGRSKHISIKIGRLIELGDEGKIKVKWIPTTENLADLLTKHVSLKTLVELRPRVLTQAPE